LRSPTLVPRYFGRRYHFVGINKKQEEVDALFVVTYQVSSLWLT
jgi:hypothetical protein